MAGYTLIDPTSVIITHLSELINRHAFELLTRQEVKHMLENLKKNDPSTIADDVVPDVVTTGELQHVLKNLLREGVPIIDMEIILETLSDYAPTVKDSDMLTEYVRQSLKRTITRRFSAAGQIKVITLDSEIEDAILKSIKRMEGGAYLTLEPEMIQRIVAGTKDQIDKVRKLVQEPIILTSPVVRIYYKKLIDQFYPNVTVLSFNDLDPSVQVQSFGVVKV
jgi:flagellar biosynthesis protein FlhA